MKKYMRKREQQYWGHFLQPSMFSSLIHCSYYVRVKPYYKVLMSSCGTGPTLFIPLHLIPPPEDPIIIDYSASFMIPEGEEYAERREEREALEIEEVMVHDYVAPPCVGE